MGFIRWGGQKFYPQKPQPYKPDINELMKPLSEKVNKGNIWGSVIMNVEKDSIPVSPTPTPSITPTNTVTPTISLTPTLTPTPTISLTPTNTVTPTISLTPTITPSTSLPASGTTEANAYLSAVVSAGGTGITSTVSAATRTLFTSLVSNGLYDKMKAFYPLLGGVSASAKFNAKNPLDTNAAFRLTFNGGWTFNASGATGNNSNTYARTYISGSTLNTRFSQHMSVYVTKATNSSDCVEMGGADTASNTYTEILVDLIAFGGNFRGYNINSTGNGVDSTSHSAMTGYFVSSRESDTKSYLYKNGSLNYSSTTVTNGTVSRELVIGARNDNGTPAQFTDRPIGFVTLGNGLTPSEIQTLSTIVNTWATSVGRNTY